MERTGYEIIQSKNPQVTKPNVFTKLKIWVLKMVYIGHVLIMRFKWSMSGTSVVSMKVSACKVY